MRIAYVGNFTLRGRDAISRRTYAIAQALRSAGHDVVFIAMEKARHEEDKRPDGGFEFKSFEYVPDVPRGTHLGARVLRQLDIAAGASIAKRLNDSGSPRFDAVIAHQPSCGLLLQLQHLRRRHGIAVICDIVDWHDLHIAGRSALWPLYWDSQLALRALTPIVGEVITISRYLDEHYARKGCNTIRVPPLLDCSEPVEAVHEGGERRSMEIRFAYAGNPHRKDLLGNVLRGLFDLRLQGVEASLRLIGVSRTTALQCLAGDRWVLGQLGDSVVFHPWMPSDEVPSVLAAADFTPLLRLDLRYARAGFPSKVVDSFGAGVPVIANVTSDLGDYLRDGVNAYVADDESPSAFVSVVYRALANREHWPSMRTSASACAEEHFDYRGYTRPLARFVERAVMRAQRAERSVDERGAA